MGEIRHGAGGPAGLASASSSLRSGTEPVQKGFRGKPAPVTVIKISVGAAECGIPRNPRIPKYGEEIFRRQYEGG